jgi:hypothetical protein
LTSLSEAHKEAKRRFDADVSKSKCYQRYIREVWQEIENKPEIKSLDGAIVRQITREEAASIILKYEWLAENPLNKAPMGYGIKAYYGLFIGDELLGANCIGSAGGQIANICGMEHSKKTVTLARGACVPHAPKNSASFFITHTCRQAFKDFGWEIFFAYSDHDAGEIGTVYQAANWFYLGKGVGRGNGKGVGAHYNYLSPDKTKLIKSYQLNHDKDKKFMKSIGWTPELGSMRGFLRAKGWTQIKDKDKGKWVWFEGPRKNRERLLALAKTLRGYEPRPYPKRGTIGLD